MRGEIYWTEESEDHIWRRHAVRPHEVEEVVTCQPHYVKQEGQLEKVYGQTFAGRYLVVLISEAQNGLDYVVSARDMEDDERKIYTERAR